MLHIYSQIDKKGFIHWIVEDNGPGIPKEKQELIFKGIYPSTKGQGKGLYNIKGSLEQYGVYFYIDSENVDGTKIHIKFSSQI